MRRAIPAIVALSLIVACTQSGRPPERMDPTACPTGEPISSGHRSGSELHVIYEPVPYSTVQELAAAADVVVVGQPTDCPEPTDESDFPGRGVPTGEPGLPAPATNSYVVVGMDQGIFAVTGDGWALPRAGQLPPQRLEDIRSSLAR